MIHWNMYTEGGFSSKSQIECATEAGSEERTHRPSLSPNNLKTL